MTKRVQKLQIRIWARGRFLGGRLWSPLFPGHSSDPQTANVTGMNFAWNCVTIVNTNSAGQGSQLKFITNAKMLGDLAERARDPGIEVYDGQAHGGYGLIWYREFPRENMIDWKRSNECGIWLDSFNSWSELSSIIRETGVLRPWLLVPSVLCHLCPLCFITLILSTKTWP